MAGTGAPLGAGPPAAETQSHSQPEGDGSTTRIPKEVNNSRDYNHQPQYRSHNPEDISLRYLLSNPLSSPRALSDPPTESREHQQFVRPDQDTRAPRFRESSLSSARDPTRRSAQPVPFRGYLNLLVSWHLLPHACFTPQFLRPDPSPSSPAKWSRLCTCRPRPAPARACIALDHLRCAHGKLDRAFLRACAKSSKECRTLPPLGQPFPHSHCSTPAALRSTQPRSTNSHRRRGSRRTLFSVLFYKHGAEGEGRNHGPRLH